MHWVLMAISILLAVLGWYGVYDATVNGNPGSNTMSLAGALGGIAEMIAACLLAILARIVQAAEQQVVLVAAMAPGQPAHEPKTVSAADEAPIVGGIQRKSIPGWEVEEYLKAGWRIVERTGLHATVERDQPKAQPQ